MDLEFSTTSIDVVVDSVVSQLLDEDVNDLPGVDFRFTQKYSFRHMNGHHLIKTNPFVLAFGDLLNELTGNLEDYTLSLGTRIVDTVELMELIQRPIVPMMKKLLYCIYRERLQNERNMIFPHVFGRIHQHQFNLLNQQILERKKLIDKRYADLLQNKKQSVLTRFEQINTQRTTEEIEARKSTSCYSCLKPAEYHCCEWRYYCSSNCQRKEADHFSKHPMLFKSPKIAILDKRCLPKTVTRPQPKLNFPNFQDFDPCDRMECESSSDVSASEDSEDDKENMGGDYIKEI